MPNFRSKIHVIPADVESENLGLSSESKRTLVAKVNIIFHCAATMRFDEELQVGIKTNLYATSQILSLAKQCPDLKVSCIGDGRSWAQPPLLKSIYLGNGRYILSTTAATVKVNIGT